MSALKLVPGDDAALIAASNIAAAVVRADCDQDATAVCMEVREVADAVIDELRRRQDEHEKDLKLRSACCVCGGPLAYGAAAFLHSSGGYYHGQGMCPNTGKDS